MAQCYTAESKYCTVPSYCTAYYKPCYYKLMTVVANVLIQHTETHISKRPALFIYFLDFFLDKPTVLFR